MERACNDGAGYPMLARDALWHLDYSHGAGVVSPHHSTPMIHASPRSGGRTTVRFGFGMRQAALLLGVLGLALGGCGTMSGGLSSESLRAPTAAAPTDTTEASEPVAAALAPDAQPTGAVVAELHAGEQLLTPTVAFSPASLAPMPEGEQPSFMVASLTPLMVRQGTRPPAGPTH